MKLLQGPTPGVEQMLPPWALAQRGSPLDRVSRMGDLISGKRTTIPSKEFTMTPKPTDHTLDQLDKDLLEVIIDNPYECPVIIDTKGIIRFISHYSKDLIGVDPVTAIGRHVKEVIKETNLHEVVETGRAKIGETLFIR